MSVGRVQRKPSESVERATDSAPLLGVSDIESIDLSLRDDQAVCFFESETPHQGGRKVLRDNIVIHDFLTKREYVINNYVAESEIAGDYRSESDLGECSELFSSVRNASESETFNHCDQEIFFEPTANLAFRFRDKPEAETKLKQNVRFCDATCTTFEYSDESTNEDDEYSSHVTAASLYDVTELFDYLNLVDCECENDVFINTDAAAVTYADYETNSLVDDSEANTSGEYIPSETTDLEHQSLCTEDTRDDLVLSPMKDINDIAMSKEAKETRSAIFQTLQGMTGSKNRGGNAAQIHNKGVSAQKRIKYNRAKYNNYTTMTNPCSKYDSVYASLSKNKSLDSDMATGNDDYSSGFSSSALDCDDSSSDSNMIKGPLLPKIFTNDSTASKRSQPKPRLTNHTTRTNYRIPGVGKYTVVVRAEPDFEITPLGYDSRYNAAPVISKEENDPPAQDVQKRSILKCRSWLRNVYSSPLSTLQPTANN